MRNSLLNRFKGFLILLSFLAIGSQAISQTNWTYQMPKPFGFLVYDASFIDANNGWATGESGCIAKTTDGGITWNYKSLPLYTGNGLTNFRPILYQVQFLNASVGYSVGSNGTIIKTTDGGTNWTYLNGPLGPVSSTGKGINNLFFFDVNNGWIIGDAPNASTVFIYKTTDGGVTWTAATNIPSGVINTPFYGIDFVDANTGYVCGQSGKVIKTADGGATWTDISLTTTNYTVVGGTATLPRTQTYRCVVACDANTAIISSQNNGCVLRTTNSGTNWYASGNQGFGMPQVATWQMAKSGPNKDTIIIAGGQARFIKSTDRGLTWATQQHYPGTTNSYNYYYAPVAVPGVAGKYIMLGASGILNVSTDGGNNWSNPYSSLGTYDGTGGSDAKNLFAGSFVNANFGMVVGAHGTLATTSNGGATWDDKSIAAMSQVTGDADYIYSVKTPSLTNSYICTASWGQIYKSTDFGFNWTLQLDKQGNDGFTGMDFIDNNNGWVCSFLGAVYRTTNGTTWAQVPSFTTSQMNAIKFIDANTGWVVGASGKIFKTTNGGTSWVAQTSGITNALYSVQFLDANNGFVAGASGKVLVTTDGGTTWNQRNIATTSQLTKILFLDNLRGWAFGFSGGIIFNTSDGGLSWNPIYAPSGDGLNDAVIPPGATKIITIGGSLFGVHGDILSQDFSQCTVSIITQPANTSVCAGSTANFNVTISGSPFATFQWQVSTDGGITFNNIAGATTSSYSFTPTGVESGYQYRCLVTNSCGSPTTTTSAAGTLTFNTLPVITQQPVNFTSCLGTPATFSVAATGTGITYQWQVSTNGGTTFSNISTGAVYLGATTNSLTIIAVAAAQSNNQFRCVVTGVCSPAANSTAAILTIPVVISAQPAAVTQCAGGTANFTVTAVGAALTYQWQVSTDAGVTYNNITNGGVYSGATAATLTITGTTAAQTGYLFRCVVSGGACNLNSSAVALTVNSAPAVVTQPVATTSVCTGQNITIAITASGTAITYQWQLSTDGGTTFNNISNGGVYSGATTNTLTMTGVLAAMNGNKYRCVVTGTCAPAATSTISTINISSPVVITAQPVNTTVCAANTATFSVTATGTINSYQWQVSTFLVPAFTNIPGATANSLTVTSNYTMNGNIYHCIISTVCAGNITTANATLFVNPTPIITLTATPSANMYPGGTATVSISNISPVAGVSYTWTKNGIVMPGVTGTSITVKVDDIGSYAVIVTDLNGCTGTSNTVLINQIEVRRLFIYPNPSSTGRFQVRLYAASNNLTPRTLTIYDAKGAMVYSQQYPISSSYQEMDVYLGNVNSGMYEVVVVDNTGTLIATGKVLITGH